MCHNSSTCHAYVILAELGHCHFLYMPIISTVVHVTTGNGTGTKFCFKWNCALGFVFSIHASVYCYYCSESKPILKFYSI